ncbi:MAG: GNAT family N-acetyltransferase [Acidobacteria bacterium]|nr:GNAT family N-acetyltransferase [Acidobacteriota bacterium]
MAVHQTTGRPMSRGRDVRDWRERVPVLSSRTVTLREICAADAPMLVRELSAASVAEHIRPAPPSVEGFKRYVRWAQQQRRAGVHVSFGIVPPGHRHAVGVVQMWPIEPDFSTAEWGLALGETYWGRGLGLASARLLIDFAVSRMGVCRLEARSVDANHGMNAILRKVGAVPEGRLRNGFRCGDVVRDYVMWAVLAEDWQSQRLRERLAH